MRVLFCHSELGMYLPVSAQRRSAKVTSARGFVRGRFAGLPLRKRNEWEMAERNGVSGVKWFLPSTKKQFFREVFWPSTGSEITSREMSGVAR